jgi:putative transposase
VIYTTNAIESLNASLRKVLSPKGHFPSDEAAIKVLYLALRNQTERWRRPMRDWKPALQHFSLYFEGRFPL